MSADHSMAAIPDSLTGRALSCLTDAPRQLASPALKAVELTTCSVGVTFARSLLFKGTSGNSGVYFRHRPQGAYTDAPGGGRGGVRRRFMPYDGASPAFMGSGL